MATLTKLCTLLCLALGAAPWLLTQTAPAQSTAAEKSATVTPPKASASDEVYPEQAYLSPSRYVNQYFGFSVDIPTELHLHPIAQPATRDGSIQLLELGGPPPADAEISLLAIPTASANNRDAKTLMRFALDQELYRGVEELRGLSKTNLSGHLFYLFETRRGIEQHVVMASTFGDYILQVMLVSHDVKTLRRLDVAFQHIVFFAPGELRQQLNAEAKPYDGPAISPHRLASLEADPPAQHIDPGKISGDFYENASIGFSYRVPQGWTLEAEGAVQPAIERDRAKQDFGRPRIGRTEHRLMSACSRTLFSLWAKRPSAEGHISYDEFGEVTVSAIAMDCFPSMKFPQEANDAGAFKRFIAQLALTQPILSDMRDAKVFTAGTNVFLFMHGTVGFQVPDDELARRLSIAMAITQQRGYLLTWFFAAPHDSELQALTDQRVMFDPASPLKEASTTRPGGGDGAAEAASVTSAAPAAVAASSSQPEASSQAGNAGPEEPSASPTPATSTESSPTPPAESGRPSLLRPGENMQSQQGKGPVIKPK